VDNVNSVLWHPDVLSVFSLVTYTLNYSTYCPAKLHVSAVQSHHRVHYSKVIALSCKYAIKLRIKIVKFLLKFAKIC
jgi:hypothetical protein